MNKVFVSIFKTNSNYFIEIFKSQVDNLINVWEGKNINDGYSFVIKELLTLNKDVSNIHFVYKTKNNAFIRLLSRKKEIKEKLAEVYNDDLSLIEYKKLEVKNKVNGVFQLLWCIKKDEQEKLNSFFNSLNIKRKSLVPIDYYYAMTQKNKYNELYLIIGYSKLTVLYYDEISLSESICFELSDYKNLIYQNNEESFNNYLNELIYLINYVIRLHHNLTINKVNLVVHNGRILKDIRFLVYNIDHNNVVILDE